MTTFDQPVTNGTGPVLTDEQREHIEKRLLQERKKALRSLGFFDQSKKDRASGDSDLSAW